MRENRFSEPQKLFVWWVGPGTEKEELQHLIPSLTRAVQKKEDFQIAIMFSSQCSAWPPQSPQKGFIPFHSTRGMRNRHIGTQKNCVFFSKTRFHPTRGHSTKNRNQQREIANFISDPTMQCWKVAWLEGTCARLSVGLCCPLTQLADLTDEGNEVRFILNIPD